MNNPERGDGFVVPDLTTIDIYKHKKYAMTVEESTDVNGYFVDPTWRLEK